MALALALSVGARAEAALPGEFQRGACIEGGRPLEPCHLDDLAALGVTCVSLNPFGWMQAPDDPAVYVAADRPQGRWFGESDSGLRQYAIAAHERGMTVMLRPHIWLRETTTRDGRDGLWLGDVAMAGDDDWAAWFTSYRAFALHYARVAEDAGIEWYSVGAELTQTTRLHPAEWRQIIAEVRGVYHGKLLYSANWWEEAEQIQFWDDLDAIGVQAYFPVAGDDDPTTDALRAGWKAPAAVVAGLGERWKRPVIFTEIGYKSCAGAAREPWEWRGEGVPRNDLQERCYQAALETMAATPAVAGAYWWKYYVDPCDRLATGSTRRALDFTWQGKPAAEILRQFYAAPPNGPTR